MLAAVRQYLVGSPGATALTVAIAIFFVSGEMYHRAWARGFPPDRRGNWWGDFLSGRRGGGADLRARRLRRRPARRSPRASCSPPASSAARSSPRTTRRRTRNPWPNRFRVAVLASRVPALAALALELARLLGSDAPPAGSLVMTGVMLVCYLLWARADLLLFAGRRGKAAASLDARPGNVRIERT